jgi:hypothetical protein
MDENIKYYFDEVNNNISNNTTNIEKINEIMNRFYENDTIFENKIRSIDYEEDDLYLFDEINNYEKNYTNKDLLLICEYYNIKNSKIMRKKDLINQIIQYENCMSNYSKILKRKKLWRYINELKKDPMMKKFVLWDNK